MNQFTGELCAGKPTFKFQGCNGPQGSLQRIIIRNSKVMFPHSIFCMKENGFWQWFSTAQCRWHLPQFFTFWGQSILCNFYRAYSGLKGRNSFFAVLHKKQRNSFHWGKSYVAPNNRNWNHKNKAPSSHFPHLMKSSWNKTVIFHILFPLSADLWLQ